MLPKNHGIIQKVVVLINRTLAVVMVMVMVVVMVVVLVKVVVKGEGRGGVPCL